MEHFKDYTLSNYQRIITAASRNYTFIPYTEYKTEAKKVVLWRHDVDLSMHRARALARIESMLNVRATYFVHLHSRFYNALETEIINCIRAIIALGHDIGLHYDASWRHNYASSQFQAVERQILFEKELLENVIGREIQAMSWHNPQNYHPAIGGGELIAGMVNAYSGYIMYNYGYCSDSFGYQRHRNIYDVVSEAKEENLQILTHPGWWMNDDEVMPPRRKLLRSINGRAANTLFRHYEEIEHYLCGGGDD